MAAPNTKPYHLPPDAVWFITGCSSGIGHALAHHIATYHPTHRLIATARNPSTLSTLPSHPNILKLPLDVTSPTSIESSIQTTLSTFHRIDILVNNAGYTLVGDTEIAEDDESRALFDTNFWGMVDTTKRVLGSMREGGSGGVILNVSSLGGFVGFPGSAFYHASKFAMEGWTEAVAKELPAEWNIHLCNIEPGGVQTNYATTSLKMMAKGRHPAYADPTYPTSVLLAYKSNEENRRLWAKPDKIAAAIYRLVSRGQRIPIRVPLGADARGMILMELEGVRRDLEEMEELSLSVGDAEQLDSIAFLQK
ncbi:SDR family oxidoreductase [Aspergillus ibericus CBS 121593]|uniref:Short-chain dehydrogenase n=1 Tax=Aspergillus ibericus CBS 121593 TaxID=1448316 RepID=A0A395HCF7_9EURO|nr:short-chain dehydrogenase [Aspergillus ibericus CBS 121593]RAL05203.1 short-chain dehydrogenase [Aspergillus ibericus CBS 121593]